MKIKLLAIVAFLATNIGLVILELPIDSVIPASNALIALNSMALSLILAARFSWVDWLVGGADKAYVIHRWLGYIAVLSLSLHWGSAQESGLAIVPALSHLGEESGEFAAIFILLLVVISALKLVPYHLWKKSHLLMGPLFLIAAFHSFFSASPFVVYSLTWYLMLVLTLLAAISWIKTLSNQKTTLVSSKVAAIKRMSGAIDIELNCEAPLVLTAGQFASISVNKKGLSEQHPFSAISCSDKNGIDKNKLRFIIGDAGDYTHKLNTQIEVGDEISIHKVAGNFTPEYKPARKRQVWIAAGVGITPFLSVLANMQSDNGATIDLIYAPGNRLGGQIITELQKYQQQLVQFNLYVLDQSERLNADHFNGMSFDTTNVDLYLCGPDKLKEQAISLWHADKNKRAVTLETGVFPALKHTFSPKGKIYSEDFDFRNAIGGNSHKALIKWFILRIKKSTLDINNYLHNYFNNKQEETSA